MRVFPLFLSSLLSFSRASNTGKQPLAAAVTCFVVWLLKKIRLLLLQYLCTPTPPCYLPLAPSGLSKGAERYGDLGSGFLFGLWVEAD